MKENLLSDFNWELLECCTRAEDNFIYEESLRLKNNEQNK